ncbi:hypothetical protein CDCA_CDCA14G3758 [Cyanidium caldarium]|uniref:Uncharacterized protein n=1 Tax=Cyanidium caldarium TaxID=2771 RepID=A0AAV9IZG6_CYACA|nr:hypothetical protein CDCA_CDCA14G3758 [Cyanidium caldarium]
MSGAYFGRAARPREFNWRTFRGNWKPRRRLLRMTREFGTLPTTAPLNSGTWSTGYGGTAALLLSCVLAWLVWPIARGPPRI